MPETRDPQEPRDLYRDAAHPPPPAPEGTPSREGPSPNADQLTEHWRPQAAALASDARLLKGFLEDCARTPTGETVLFRLLPRAQRFQVRPKPWRVALELMELWLPLEASTEGLIDTALQHASTTSMDLTAVFDLLEQHALPWSILEPMAQLPAAQIVLFDDPHPELTELRPPTPATLSLLPDLAPEYDALAHHLGESLGAIHRILGLRRGLLDRSPAAALAGDQILRVEFFNDLFTELRAAWHDMEGARVKVRALLEGADPARVRERPVLAAHRDIAAGIAARINACLPDHRLLDAERTRKPGVYRQVVLEWSAGLIVTIYGVPITATDVKNAIGKRRKP